jgi:hypothetical protein
MALVPKTEHLPRQIAPGGTNPSALRLRMAEVTSAPHAR